MLERWLLFLGVVLASIGAAWAGDRLGRGEPPPAPASRRATIAVALGLATLLVRGWLRFHPAAEAWVLSADWYPILRPWWSLPPAFLVLGVGVQRMSTPLARRGVALFAALLFLGSAHRLWVTASFAPEHITGVVRAQDGVCLQSTDYTCGAASAAMLLHQHGVKATERDLAERSWTNALTGTDELCVARGLRRSLPDGWRVEVVETDWAGLRALNAPAAATRRFQLMVDHWVLIESTTETHAVVLDPLAGRQTLPRAELEALWRGVLVVVRRPG